MAKYSEETRRKLPNLANIEGTIASIVQENSNAIRTLFEDSEVSDDEFKDFILELFEKANQTKYVRQSIEKIKGMDRNNIVYYIYNMNLAGSGNGIIR